MFKHTIFVEDLRKFLKLFDEYAATIFKVEMNISITLWLLLNGYLMLSDPFPKRFKLYPKIILSINFHL